VTEENSQALWRLRNRWLGTCQISLPHGLSQAIRFGGHESLTAATAHELGRKVQADYGTLRTSA
jgi:hypothetical protein